MAYSTEANAGFRITGFTFGGVANFLGRVRLALEKIIDREVIQADGNNTPTARPVDRIDARLTVDFLDQSGGISHSTAAASCVANYTEANGTSVSITVGSMVPSSIRHAWGRNQGGFGAQQDLELEGALTYTPTA